MNEIETSSAINVGGFHAYPKYMYMYMEWNEVEKSLNFPKIKIQVIESMEYTKKNRREKVGKKKIV